MISIQEFTERVKKLIDILESLIRGGASRSAVDIDLTISISEELLFWASSNEVIEISSLLPNSQKKDMTALAVKLNTKARALSTSSSSSTGKLRTLAKVLSGWIVFRFHDPTVKSFQVIIPILSSAIPDFDRDEMKLICCEGVSKAWTILNDLITVSSSLSAVQFQDLKVHVLESLIEEARLHVVIRRENSFEQSKQCILKSIELSSSLDILYSVNLADKVLAIASKIGSSSMMLDQAKHFYLFTMNIIQLVRNKMEFKELKQDTIAFINSLKVRTSLSLAYIDMENGDYEKAMSYIQSLEGVDSASSFHSTIVYAKFSIYAKQMDWQSAESSIKALFRLPISFAIAIDAIKTIVKIYCQKSSITENNNPESILAHFATLFNKFPRDPELSVIRIIEMQSLILLIDNNIPSCNSKTFSTNLAEIMNSILQDNISRQRVLQPDQLDTVKNILFGRIRCHRSHQEWNDVLTWCDMILSLGDTGDTCQCILFKVDALINLDKFSEALDLVTKLAQNEGSSTTILIMFKAALHALPPRKAVDTVLSFLRNNVHDATTNQSEILSRIFQCCSIVNDSSNVDASKRQVTLILLLKAWIDHYYIHLGWQGGMDMTSKGRDPHHLENHLTYYRVAHNYLQQIIGIILHFEVDHSNAQQPVVQQNTLVSSTHIHSDLDEKVTDSHMDIHPVASNDSATIPSPSSTAQTNIVHQSIQYLATLASQLSNDDSMVYKHQNISINVSLQSLHDLTLPIAEHLSTMHNLVSDEGRSKDILGSDVDLEHIGNVFWHFGCLLSRADLYQISPDHDLSLAFSSMHKQSTALTLTDDEYSRHQLASAFFEAAENTFNLLSLGDRNTICLNQVISLMLSSASRLDAESLEIVSLKSVPDVSRDTNKDFDHVDKPETQSLSSNLTIARSNLRRAQSLIRTLSGFEDAALLKQYRNLVLILEFSVLCRSSPKLSSTIIDKFLNDNLSSLLDLSVDELMRCAEISSSEPSGTVEISRRLYMLALQVATRNIESKQLIGNLYSKIIDLSPSRQARLETIREFSQLLVASGQSDEDSFSTHDIDRICSLAYNAGVTLSSLEQYQLASDVVTLALQMISYCSAAFLAEWQGRMQDAYADIIAKQASRNQSFLLDHESQGQSNLQASLLPNQGDRHRSKDIHFTHDTLQ